MTVPTSLPDPRTHAYDPEEGWAEERLRGLLPEGDWTWVTGRPARAGNARLSLRARPDALAPQVTEAWPGEALELLWEAGAWVRVRTIADGYLGWARREGVLLGERPAGEERLTVGALRAHAYAGPGVSQPVVAELCWGAVLTRGEGAVVTESGRRWVPVTLPDGSGAWVGEAVLSPLRAADVAEVALRLLETPYVWGGRSAWGLDCSGLTGLAYGWAGFALPRDADLQQAFLTPVATPQRGDLAFFPGHVGLMLDERRMVHANATHMRVTVETLGEGEYGARLAGMLTGFGRWSA
ncbi:peptidase [Deinococcus sp. RL]|uniref:C40 family peptidase n=1 Tax=Deinococcus sp. RL TaxID=1489678 RepID=UPI0004D6798D|nr:NlpC/P60 family protein [Deinococcus sp. RL]KEF35409.1 peptidase [Deinococcus sp. RL]